MIKTSIYKLLVSRLIIQYTSKNVKKSKLKTKYIRDSSYIATEHAVAITQVLIELYDQKFCIGREL